MAAVILLNGVPQKGRIALIQREANGNYTIESITIAPLEEAKPDAKDSVHPNKDEPKR